MVHAATTPPGAELVPTIPITRPARAKPRSVLSLGPRRLGPLQPGARVRLYGEVQVSLTCVVPKLPRCIGRTYSFSPRVAAQIVLGSRARAAQAPEVLRVGRTQRLRCQAEPIPDRNHHCVFALHPVVEVPDPSRLPCQPSRCFVNLVVTAQSRRAMHGDRLIIGADRPNGTVRRNKGSLAAVLTPPGPGPPTWRLRAGRLRHRELHVRVGSRLRVVYAARVPALRRGDAVAAIARQVTSIARLSYAAFVSDRLILARSPTAVRPATPSPAASGGYLTATNGFNCTHGPSRYRTPCAARKAGALAITSRPAPGPWYVNLISRSKPKHVAGTPSGRARILHRGFLAVTRYR